MEKSLIRQSLEEFRTCTLKIIDFIQNDDYDSIDDLISRRQEILDSIAKMEYSNEEYSEIVKELDIFSLQKMLSDLTNERRKILRDNIEVVEKNKVAVHSYNSRLKGAAIFSKKI